MADINSIPTFGVIGGQYPSSSRSASEPSELAETQRAFHELERRRFELEQIGYHYREIYNVFLSKDPTQAPEDIDKMVRAHMRMLASFDPESEAPDA